MSIFDGISLNNIILSVTALVLIANAVIYWRIWRASSRSSIREATQQVYQEWWSDELNGLRWYFYEEFLPFHRKKLVGKGMKDIETIIIEDKGRIRQLCYFFDRVGWLGAAGLIDVDYILGPMQHSVRRVWMSMEPLIQNERQPRDEKLLDSVYQLGFEWLFRRSAKKHQAYLVRSKFRQPRVISLKKSKILRDQIDADEAKFHDKL